MTAVLEWATSTDALNAGEVEDLPDLPRGIRVLYWFWMDANVEGVWYFISESWGGLFWTDLHGMCRMIGATRSRECLEKVDALFPGGLPRTEEAMHLAMQEFEGRDPDPLREIDRAFGPAIEEEIPRCLHDYLRDNTTAVEQAHRL